MKTFVPGHETDKLNPIYFWSICTLLIISKSIQSIANTENDKFQLSEGFKEKIQS